MVRKASRGSERDRGVGGSGHRLGGAGAAEDARRSRASPPAAAAPAPAVPTFVNGMAQAVFSTTTASWINHDLWVELDVDTDGDGLKDRVHVDVSRPAETDTDGLKVPVIFEDSPYYAGTANAANWAVDHELGVPPASRLRAPLIAGRAHTPDDLRRSTRSTWVPRGFAVVHSESPGTGSSTGCPNSGAPIETLGATAVIDWLNGRRKGYTTKAGTIEAPPATWHNGNTAMMGTSYNGTLPIAAASTGVEGLKAIVPISAISDWYDYYRANGMTRAPRRLPGRGPRRAHRVRLLAQRRSAAHDLLAGDPGRRGQAGPRVRQPLRVLGRAQLHARRARRQGQGRVADRPRQRRQQRHDQERRAVLRGAQEAGRPATSSTSIRAATAARRRTSC